MSRREIRIGIRVFLTIQLVQESQAENDYEFWIINAAIQALESI